VKVRDIMTRDLVTVRPATRVTEAAQLMRDANIGDVLVTEGDQLLGILTDRDIVVRADAQAVDGRQAPVGDFMTQSPTVVSADASVEDAANLMAQQQIRRLPVEDRGHLAGIISLGDVAVDAMTVGGEACSPACTALEEISEPAEPAIAHL